MGEDADDHAGWDLTTAGDVDGDGLADVLISAAFQNASATDAGAVYVILAANLQGDATIDLADATIDFWERRVPTSWVGPYRRPVMWMETVETTF